MSPTDAFNAGSTFGNTEIGTAKGAISDANAKDPGKGIPNYTDNDPASANYLGGYGSLTGPASTQANDCVTNSSDPDAHIHGKCEATRMLLKDPGKKNAMFPLDKKLDPLVVKRNVVSADAESYLGSLIVKGDYNGCVKRTITNPDQYETEFCHQFLTRNDQSCTETLTVTVTVIETCVPGTYYAAVPAQFGNGGLVNVEVFCDLDSKTNGFIPIRFTPSGLHGGTRTSTLNVPTTPFTNTDSCSPSASSNCETYVQWVYKGDTVTGYIGYKPGVTHGCDVNGMCTYAFSGADDRWGNGLNVTSGPFEMPYTKYIESDSWDDQCVGWKAKVAQP